MIFLPENHYRQLAPWRGPNQTITLTLHKDNLEWKRITDLERIQLYLLAKESGERIVIQKDRQGATNDSYFVAALSSLGSRIEQSFVTKDINEAGIYAFKFYLNGKEDIIAVDDYLPCETKDVT